MGAPPPEWALRPSRTIWQYVWDWCMTPVRLILLPDSLCERLRLTSLRAERFRAVLPQIRGRLLDIGAGDNQLVAIYKKCADEHSQPGSKQSVGVDVFDWGSDTILVQSSASLPFPDASFDTISFLACINHIPERREALEEARRVLRPDGCLLVTMIGRFIGELGHKLWWYSEDKYRNVDEHELMGMNEKEIHALLDAAGFEVLAVKRFVYGLNRLYIARPRRFASLAGSS